MPDGQVSWIDPKTEVAHLIRRGREYLAPLSEVESKARVPGARVSFDIERLDGVDGAANVTMRRGTRTTTGHRRFGDLTGSRKPGAKVASASATQLGVDVTTQPVRVATIWATALAEGDLDGALSLYTPDALVHTESGELQGRSRLRSYLDATAPCRFEPDNLAVHGADDVVRVTWPDGTCFGTEQTPVDSATSYLRVDHGHIVEHWDRLAPPSEEDEPVREPFVLVARGSISDQDREYLEHRFDRLTERLTDPVLFTRVKLTVSAENDHDHQVQASSTLDLSGHIVRARVSTATVTEAVDALVTRLQAQLDRYADKHRPTKNHGESESWHHGDLRTPASAFFDRPVEDRELVRQKAHIPDELTVEEAAWEMEQLDHAFFLFQELGTGQDCLLGWNDTTLELHCLDSTDAPDAGTVAVERAPNGGPTLTVRAALERLDAGHEPFVFFKNEQTGSGNVVYRRFDGHYGVITPPTSPD